MENKNYTIEARAIENFKPHPLTLAKFVEAGRFITMTYLDKPMNNRCHIKKLTKDTYRHIKSGEVRMYTVRDEDQRRRERIRNLRRTFDDLKAVLRTNFEGEKPNQVFITLTYCENMTDTKVLAKDFEKFMAELTGEYADHNFVWVAVMEPQGRGAWHIHLMLKSDQPSLYIPFSVLNRLWRVNWVAANLPPPVVGETKRGKLKYAYRPLERRGMVSISSLKSDDVGNYYSAYFTHCIAGSRLEEEEIECCGEILGENETGQEIFETEQGHSYNPKEMSKRLVKGQRLHMYPKYFKFYRCSQKVQRPKKYFDYLGDPSTEAELEGMKKQDVKTYEILKITEMLSGQRTEKLNTVHKVTYVEAEDDTKKIEERCSKDDPPVYDTTESTVQRVTIQKMWLEDCDQLCIENCIWGGDERARTEDSEG
jgi:hypothetical protein